VGLYKDNNNNFRCHM